MLVALEGTIPLWTCTKIVSTGVPTDAAATPTYSIYEEGATSPMTGANDASLTGKLDSKTGLYYGTDTAASADGFERCKSYLIRYEATVSGNAWSDEQTFTVV